MREAGGVDMATIPALQGIIANLECGVQGFFDVAFLQYAADFVGPNAGIAIGLQFEANGQAVCFDL